MLHLLNVADREWQRRFLEQQAKEREERMSKPSIYIFVEGGMVQEVRATHELELEALVVFDKDDMRADQGESDDGKLEPLDSVAQRLYGMSIKDAVEHSKAVW